MRRQTALKAVSREEGGRSATPTVERGTPVERSIFSTLHDMEKMMEDAFHRPLFGMSTLPFRHLLQELGSFGEFAPAVDIYEEKGEVIVKTELPGMKREDISVKLVDNNLIISGEKKSEERIEQKDYLRLERSHGSFNRTVRLPEGIDPNHVKATFKDGVLELRMPKVGGKETGRRIEVK